MMRLFPKPMCMWPVSHVSHSVLQDLDWVLMIKGTGEKIFNILDYIRTKRPKVFILENVPGLVQRNDGRYDQHIMAELKTL